MAEIRFRVRGPDWSETVTATEDWTVGRLVEFLKEKRGVQDFQLMYGWPAKVMDLGDKSASLAGLGLKGQMISLQPAENASASSAAPATASPAPVATKKPEQFTPKPVEADETTLEWPEKEGYLVLRVMPDDNSCMFTAFGGVIPLPDPAPVLRRQVADYILLHQNKYNQAVLEMTPLRYAERIQAPDKWGGAIELSILSDIYDIEICSIDVKTLRVDRFGEGKLQRCIILYSGIHYDRIAFTIGLDMPVDVDVVKWSRDDDEVVEKARELARKLQKVHYYTDTTDFVLKCDVPGCGWIGAGQKEAIKHMEETGHSNLSELRITD